RRRQFVERLVANEDLAVLNRESFDRESLEQACPEVVEPADLLSPLFGLPLSVAGLRLHLRNVAASHLGSWLNVVVRLSLLELAGQFSDNYVAIILKIADFIITGLLSTGLCSVEYSSGLSYRRFIHPLGLIDRCGAGLPRTLTLAIKLVFLRTDPAFDFRY